MLQRRVPLAQKPAHSFFLWWPRQTGKSTLLRSRYAGAPAGLRELVRDSSEVKRRFVVSLDPRPRVTEDGIEILPYVVFAQRLWQGDLLR